MNSYLKENTNKVDKPTSPGIMLNSRRKKKKTENRKGRKRNRVKLLTNDHLCVYRYICVCVYIYIGELNTYKAPFLCSKVRCV